MAVGETTPIFNNPSVTQWFVCRSEKPEMLVRFQPEGPIFQQLSGRMAELADAPVLEAGGEIRVGSSPSMPTTL